MYGEKFIRFIYKYKIILLGVFFIGLYLVFGLKGSGTENKDANMYDSGYTTIKSVPGVSFEVLKNSETSAQAVLEVSPNVNFVSHQTYMYKNGADTYMLFNIKNSIVVCKKGTDYNLSKGTDILEKKSLNGIRFKPTSVINNSGNISVVSVTAEVVITNELYNDFIGKVATIRKDDTEWTLFVGTTERNNDFVEHIITSFKENNEAVMVPITYEVDIEEDGAAVEVGSNTTESTEHPVVDTPSVDTPNSENSNIEDTDTENNDTGNEATGDDTGVISEPVEEVPVEEPVESPDKEPAEEDATTEDATKDSDSAESSEVTDNTHEETVVVQSNQNSYKKQEGKAYTSNIYSMLDVGNTGYVTILGGNGQYERGYVRVTQIKKRDEVQSLIDAHINSGNAYYDEMNAPQGMHWEACVYDVKYPSADGYLNVYIKGLDGNNLVYNGVVNTARTYDIPSANVDGEWTIGMVTFYAVPNGCEEYALQFGDGSDEEKAYYHIK